MDSPSRIQFNRDGEPTGSPKSYAIAPSSLASHLSDGMPAPVQVERDLAYERLHEERALSEQVFDGSRVPTISYEEAMVRELEYRKRVQRPLPGSSVGSGSCLPIASPATCGIKRKAVALPGPTLQISHDQKLPRKQLQDKPAQQHHLQHQPLSKQFEDPRGKQLHHHKSSLHHFHKEQQTSSQWPNNRRPQPRAFHGQKLISLESRNTGSIWCNLCNVKCTGAFNLQQHLQGKTHLAKQVEVLNGKSNGLKSVQYLWCKECNIPCIDEMSLAQHRAGKKHVARLLALQAKNGAAGPSNSNFDDRRC